MDMENVLKAWECCNPFNRKCNECPYEKDCYHDGISRHMVADALVLLKEQEAYIEHLEEMNEKYGYINIVRCKDCKYYDKDMIYCNKFGIQNIDNDWFCADGERKSD